MTTYYENQNIDVYNYVNYIIINWEELETEINESDPFTYIKSNLKRKKFIGNTNSKKNTPEYILNMIDYLEECNENDKEEFTLLIKNKEMFLDKLKEFLNKDLKWFFEKKKFKF